METQQTQIRQCTLADSALVVRVSQQGSAQTVHGRCSCYIGPRTNPVVATYVDFAIGSAIFYFLCSGECTGEASAEHEGLPDQV